MKEKKLKVLRKLLQSFINLSFKKGKRQRKNKIKNFILNINNLDLYSKYHISNFLQRRKDKYPKRTRKSLIAKIKNGWDFENKAGMDW